MYDFSKSIAEYLFHLINTIERLNKKEINTFLNLLIQARNEDRQIFIMGNGGSAATASHFVCDFNKGCSYESSKKPFKFICLNDNVPTIMAYANDVGYEEIFVQQLKNLFSYGDLVIGISGSGNSKNVLKAIEYANEHGGTTIGLTGFNGGKLKEIAQHSVHVDINNMQMVEDIHMMIDHLSMTIISRDK